MSLGQRRRQSCSKLVKADRLASPLFVKALQSANASLLNVVILAIDSKPCNGRMSG